MRFEVKHPEFKSQRLTIETAKIFHKSKLLLNGTVVNTQKGLCTVTADSGAATSLQLKYRWFDPVPKIKIGEEVVEIVSPMRWFEYTWIMALPFGLVVTGGTLGGLCGAVAVHVSCRAFRSDRGFTV
ncbi:hypothetical protein D6R50_21030 [Aeromonas veronii]|uniref:Uncharacterized protein n=1 Tax=Aeromonas veronii TaxID=654 RepID=A0A3A9I7D3_AERVE|nr:hypothetical protein [Aeromonas veronii]RKJ85680.1 hypothetical protein D6R50_21030 [Aeromonas veronii]